MDTDHESSDAVFTDLNLLEHIATSLDVKHLLVLSAVSTTCRFAVGKPSHWHTIAGAWLNGQEPQENVTYAQAATVGNKLCSLLRQYGQHCQELMLAKCRWLQAHGLEEVPRCQQLRVLDFSYCTMYRTDLFALLLRSCPKLEALSVRGCWRLSTPEVFQELLDAPKHLRLDLKQLDIKGLMFRQDAVHGLNDASDGDLAFLVERLAGGTRLASLHVGWVGEATLPGEERDGEGPYLGHVAGMCAVLERACASLEVLDASGIFGLPMYEGPVDGPGPGRSALEAALGGASRLRALNLSTCSVDTHRLGSGLRACPTTRLTYLNLRGADWVGDEHLVPLLERNPGLRHINMGCCDLLTDRALQAAATHCSGALQALDLCYAPRMTAAGLRAALQRLPHLVDLGFSGLANITDADVAAFAERLPRLEMIGLGGISELTDASLAALAQHCPLLKDLYAADLPLITHQGILSIVHACPRLQRVCVQRCPRLPSSEQWRAAAARYAFVYDGDRLPPELAALPTMAGR